MYCINCGNELYKQAEFCTNCGSGINNNSKVVEDESEKVIYQFRKDKWLGLLLLFTLDAKVEVNGDKLDIEEQKSYIGIFKGKKKVSSLDIYNIKSISVNKAIDLMDGIYTIIFIALGIVVPIFFLLAILCLWSGYGQRIVLNQNGIKTKIHCKVQKETLDFVNYIEKRIR